ncbi:hypothetical protein ACFQZE_19910 [Paenibacillus sp. GCM10027627]|uniref:hypothetical protein n=1 Tax=unclassified Paenibacillus TaxID=185978 RepID=UPI003629FB3E
MLKGLAWVGKLVAAGLILSFLSIWTTGYIVTSYVESVLKQFELPLEVPPMAMSGVWGALWGSDPLLSSDSKELSAEEGKPGTALDSDAEAKETFGEIEQPPLTDVGMGAGAEAAGIEAEAEPETGMQEGTAGTNGGESEAQIPSENGGVDGTETAVTVDEIESAKEGMNEEDKAQLFQLLMTKLPQESWQKISEYVENGLTETELTSVQQIMAQHLDQAEYDSMMEILKKY